MNFTREPIIETVITPREGCKLVVRSSKGVSQEDYFVDAVEVVSFGHSFFFRSQERPKSFLVPVSDYEILELKETRMVLKNVSTDRSIKIGGGREPVRAREEEPQDVLAESRPAPQVDPQQRGERKRDKRRRGRRGRDRDRQDMPRDHDRQDRDQDMSRDQDRQGMGREHDRQDMPRDQDRQGMGREQEHPREMRARRDARSSEELPSEQSQAGGPTEEKAPSFISKLFPPPPTLIKESLSRYKPAEGGSEEIKETSNFEETIFEHPNPSEGEIDDENEE